MFLLLPKISSLHCWQRGQDRFVLDKDDAISSTNLWLIQFITVHLPHHTSIPVSFSLSLPVSLSLFVLHPFLSTLGTCCIFINSSATPTLRPWANTARMREKVGEGGLVGGWLQEEGTEDGRKGCRGLISVWSDGGERSSTMNRCTALGDKPELQQSSCCGVQQNF